MSGNVFAWLLPGVLIGCVAYFLVDQFLRRRRQPQRDLQAQVERLEQGLAERDRGLRQARADLQASTEQRIKAENDLSAANLKWTNADVQWHNLRLAKLKLESELQASWLDVEELEVKVERLQAEVKAAKAGRAKVQSDLALSRLHLADAQMRIAALEAELLMLKTSSAVPLSVVPVRPAAGGPRPAAN